MIRKRKPSGGSKITPQKARVLIRIFELSGYEITRQKGSHVIMRSVNKSKSLAIPNHPGQDVQPAIIIKLIREAGLTRDNYLNALKDID